MHTEPIERCEQTQIRSRLCEPRQRRVHSTSTFPLERKIYSYPELSCSLSPFHSHTRTEVEGRLEENKRNCWKCWYITTHSQVDRHRTLSTVCVGHVQWLQQKSSTTKIIQQQQTKNSSAFYLMSTKRLFPLRKTHNLY